MSDFADQVSERLAIAEQMKSEALAEQNALWEKFFGDDKYPITVDQAKEIGFAINETDPSDVEWHLQRVLKSNDKEAMVQQYIKGRAPFMALLFQQYIKERRKPTNLEQFVSRFVESQPERVTYNKVNLDFKLIRERGGYTDAAVRALETFIAYLKAINFTN